MPPCTQILSPTHILAAAYRAITDLLAGRLKSRNVHSEVVFSLSMNNNVSFCPTVRSHFSNIEGVKDGEVKMEQWGAGRGRGVERRTFDFGDKCADGLADRRVIPSLRHL